MFRIFVGFLALVVCSVALSAVTAEQKKGEELMQAKAVPKEDMDELVNGMNTFAFDLYRQIAAKTDGNIVFSPYSISSALAMTYAGARGKTAEEMAKVLHFTLPPERLHAASGQLSADLQKEEKDRPYQLFVANALWGQKGLPFVPEFLQLTQRKYGAGLKEVDFAADPHMALGVINRWVEQQTKNKIQRFLNKDHVHKGSQLILTNAIYFQSAWNLPFVKAATKEGDFGWPAGQMVRVALMNEVGLFEYFEGDKFQLLDIFYHGGALSCLVLLPKKADGLSQIESGLTAARMTQWLGQRKMRKVNLTLPQFQMTVEFELREDLKQIGMKEMFSRNADFSGIISPKGDFGVTEVVHKAHIAADEQGTEAAAATAVILGRPLIMPNSGVEPPPVVFRADHPFLFMIRDNRSGSLLFIGRVSDPRASTAVPKAV